MSAQGYPARTASRRVTYQGFILAMMGTPGGKLRKADPAKLASKYSVPLDWAKMSLKHWLGRV
jgi:hypothetical protein